MSQQNNLKLTQDKLPKCASGIQGLDEITGGGLPKGRPTLVCGYAGCGKTLLAMQFLVNGVVNYDEPGVFVSFEESAAELCQNVASLGWDLPALIEQGKFAIDYIHLDRSEIQETGEYNLEGLFMRLAIAIDKVKAKRVVLDTLEVLFGGLENGAIVRSEMRRLFRWLKERGVSAIVTAESTDNSLTRQGLEEFVSDCVIRLEQHVSDRIATRTLQIIKYRGSKHGTNQYPFLIQHHGISVVPITSLALDHQVSNERISTGIPRLDTMLGGKGYYRGSSILITGTAGTGKSSIAAHFAHATCQRGEKCLYIAFEESANQIIRNMRSVGLELEGCVTENRLKFQAARPTLYGLEMHLVNLYGLVRDFHPSVVIIDPISNLESVGNAFEVKSFLMRLIDFLKTQCITTLVTSLTQGGEPLEHTDAGVSSLMDTWLVLRDVEIHGERNRLLYAIKSRGMQHSNQVREFRLSDRGLELVDVYLGAKGILTGTARSQQEFEEKTQAWMRQQELQKKQRDIERKRALMDAQIKALQVDFESEQEEFERLLEGEQIKEKIRLDNEQQIAESRYADPDREDSGESS
ncbi:circadian clock protein KaiC [Phormidium sp. CCY1219]|uniref:circadian clock protein KaiC n=1 Tax=Phormidium sp. CCY1219 TaxID=2886104 RepID=UPI002D1F850A|nr:circadian clock protein KaiC [Phormidium sp. CCY1219]MEB3828373.1 circadian clock protein KaiC [Phormidium sp. CCY1219]